jgi:hypothetical protein
VCTVVLLSLLLFLAMCSSSSVNSGIVRLSISQDVDISELEVCHRDDGAPWVLGRGSFGMVFKPLRRGVQEVAIKKVGLQLMCCGGCTACEVCICQGSPCCRD